MEKKGLLEGKTALITGAARGIGKAIALRFAQEGANIAFTDLAIDEEHGGLETERELNALGVKAKGYASNAADFAQTEATVKQVVADFGSVDILVNNAGITKDGLMLRMSEAQWDAVIAVNLKSAFNFIHACIPYMMRQRDGRLALIDWGGATPRGYAIYGLIRAADSLGIPRRTLARELRWHGERLGDAREAPMLHLLGALGHYTRHLGEFPLERFVQMAQRCHHMLRAAQ